MTGTERRPTVAATTAGETGWVACAGCRGLLYHKRFARHLMVCQDCGHHAPLTAPQRLQQLLDPGTQRALGVTAVPHDPLGFVDSRPYLERLRTARAHTALDEAVVCARGAIRGQPLVVAAMDFRFMGGSLGSAVGELITIAAETALREQLPLLLVTASGGARMQEGALSLMQMAKTSQALAALDEAALLTISLVTDPTYGGVAASFATLTDIILAEPGARMGFAGPRVIQQTIRQQLPEGFQTAEFLLERGLVDDVQPRGMLQGTLGRLLAVHRARRAPPRPRRHPDPRIRRAEDLPVRDAWEAVQLARHPDRPTTLDHLHHMLDGFLELRGDRAGGECPAVVGGLGRLDGMAVMVIGHQKGHSTRELISRNFGMPRPAGYRKAARLMRLAARLRFPVITFVDTPGAYPGVEAEEHGQAIAIAENLRLMSELPVPVVTVVTGEGGSGGALALGVANRVLACANAIYSVISPEGCAAILWKQPEAAPAAAAAMRIDARELLRLGLVDGVIPEPEGGAHQDPLAAAELLVRSVSATLDELLPLGPQELIQDRRRRFRRFGADAIRSEGGRA
jgi:acetyl-CoA carboxylase carboxyl transferase alpha subunit/acetyl-CoA carboxylase carboxyl transferase beta subunit